MGVIKPQFVGLLHLAPMDPASPEEDFRLDQDFGQVTSDGRMAIAMRGSKINGASIPWMAQPLLGAPMAPRNRFWATPHDAGYKGTAVVLDLAKVKATQASLLDLLENWRALPRNVFDQDASGSKQWWDKVQLLSGARLSGVKDRYRRLIYFGVWLGGRKAWHRSRGLGLMCYHLG